MKLDEECRRESPSSVATVKHWVRSNVPLFARELLAGGAAGAIAKTCVAPLERTKILLMTGKAQSDALGTLRALVAAEGLAGLFRGNGASCLRIVPYAAIHFSAYEFYRRQLQECLAPTATAQQPAAQQHTGGSPAELGGTGAAAAPAATPGSRGRGLVRPAAAGARRGGEEGSSELRPSGDDVEQVGSPALTSSIDASTSTHHTGRPPASPAPPGPTPAPEATPAPAASPVAPAAASARATRLGPGWDLLAGSAAGATAVLLTYPLDIIRTRLAWATEIGAPGSTGPGSAAAAAGGGSVAGGGGGHRIAAMLVHTYTHEGVAGLYRGLAPTLYGILPYAGLKFYVYASLKNWYKDSISASSSGAAGGASKGSSASGGAGERLPLPVMLAFGGVSGLLAQTVTYPLDVVRRRMQVAGSSSSSRCYSQGSSKRL
ncbi:hypothetical protein CHLRE_12g548152v5 [Chlamydomonas reinhardtii]|uniref:Mitochondrial carrier protein n=1 Tax=Chlamydomonas reinhardtii TaxID=3055 RepID=A0A2K3D728_CHLRE|nr:uncharacterized protein CHLRE_12g548152v5 [Chlamydomonas reinhardtii]PNW76335.1 hypothetical protein CHLRE_12g548152v5 [Chlamydomonas reinhardtii]